MSQLRIGDRAWPSWWRRLLRPRPVTGHIAFGTFCHIAAALRDTGLRRRTGPLDWVFSTPAMIEACLADRFADLLDPSQLESVPATELSHGAKRQCRHPAYEARFGLPILFNHHDPAASKTDRAAFVRAVGRMLQTLDRPGRSHLYMMSERSWPEADLHALTQRLGSFRAETRLVILTLVQGERGCAVRKEVRGLLDLLVTVGSPSLGARFADPADDAHLAAILLRIAADTEGAAGRPSDLQPTS